LKIGYPALTTPLCVGAKLANIFSTEFIIETMVKISL
jgi:hypothetical protein